MRRTVKYLITAFIILIISTLIAINIIDTLYHRDMNTIISPTALKDICVDIIIPDVPDISNYSSNLQTNYEEMGYSYLMTNEYLTKHSELKNLKGIRYKLYVIAHYKELKQPSEALTITLSDVSKAPNILPENIQYTPEDVEYIWEDGEIVFTPGITGIEYALDLPSNISFIEITDLPTSYALKIKQENKFLNKNPTVLGKAQTQYSGSDESNRNKNMMTAINKINGIKLLPNQVFSMYDTISPFTEDEGYFLAGVIKGDEFTNAIGGGVCQITTTLYNSVLKAELGVLERHNHSTAVTYVDKGFDATIAGRYVDFKFKNNLHTTIYIFMRMHNGCIESVLVGDEYRPPNRKISFNSCQDEQGIWHLIKTITNENGLVNNVEINTSTYG